MCRVPVFKKESCSYSHKWELITGKGYDYASDHYRCKLCGVKVARFFGERVYNEDFPASTFLP